MEKKDHPHDGHRQRLLEKVATNPQALADHELLEAILFYSLPRIDTNPLAHKLFKTFGSVDALINASYDELASVNGVGKSTAILLTAIGEFKNRAKNQNRQCLQLNNFENLKKELFSEFFGQNKECCVFIMLDANFKRKCQLVYTDLDKFSVGVDVNEVVTALAMFKPTYAILAHNHQGKSCEPSKDDDLATDNLNVICRLHGVRLIEHVIFKSENEYYSYRFEGRIQNLADKTDGKSVLSLGGFKNEQS